MNTRDDFEIRCPYDIRVYRKLARIGRPSGFVEPNGYVKDESFPVCWVDRAANEFKSRKNLTELGLNDSAFTLAERYANENTESIHEDAVSLVAYFEPTDWERMVARAAGLPTPKRRMSRMVALIAATLVGAGEHLIEYLANFVTRLFPF